MEKVFKLYRLFIGLKEEELNNVSRKMRKQVLKRREVIAKEGEHYPESPLVYMISKGEVSLMKRDSSGDSQKIGVMEEGNVFGVENVLGKLKGLSAYPLTYKVSQDSVIYTLSNEDLKQVLSPEGYTTVALNMTRYLSTWMRAGLERCATMEVLRGYLRI
jgi:CRP-like cAMP-binding protein